ncbi:MAG: SufE family protein [Opitutaceae bacterium]|nr:SufE family protein [Opitutaceae bacterium]
MSLTDKLQRTVEEFSLFEDPHERLAAVIDRVRRLPPLPEAERTEAHRVQGCVSVVWLVGEHRDGHCFFRSDATSPLVRGLVGFVSTFFNDTPAAELRATDADPLAALDLVRNLSPTRRNGLAAVRAAIIDFARRCD